MSKVFQHKDHSAPERYQYRECGLDNVWLHGGFRLEKEDGDEFLYIEDQDELHRVIALSIVERGDRMTGRELWFIRQELGLSQVQLARLIRQDVQAVARWEKGKNSRPLPGAADRLVRLLYLEHDRGTVNVQDLLQQLTEADAAPRDRVFEQADGGWHLAA